MPLVRFVHAADLHLDSPFAGIRDVQPEIAATLYQATFAAYHNIIELCLEEQVDALLVAGDVFDSADRSLRAQIKFVEGLNTLQQAAIQSFVCHGNHDPLDGWEAQIDMPPGCHRFGPSVQQVPLFKDAPDKVVVHGVSYPQRNVRHNLIPEFGRVAAGPFHIALLHANVGNNSQHDAYAPCSLSDLEQTHIDYWALGHVHSRQVLRHATPTVVYPGNPQGRHPNEKGEHGVYLVEVSDTREVKLDFRPVDVVRWETVSVNINNLQSEQELLNAIDAKLTERQAEADGRALFVRLSLYGRGDLHPHLTRPHFSRDLLDVLNTYWQHQSPLLWCERIELSTTATFDREHRRYGVDFIADLLKLSDIVQQDAPLIANMRGLLDDLYVQGPASHYLHNHTPTDEEMKNLLADAETLCLDELLEADDA